jgi:glutaredoxin
MPDIEGRRVRLYSLSTCPACKRVKQFLTDQGVPYEEILVDTLDSGEQWLATKEVKKYNPAATFPTVVVEQTVVGFNEEALRTVLGLS